MMNHSNPLCCCEYYDSNHERNHILACCCNCQDLDESFESLITCKKIPSRHKQGMLTTLQDRIRIPWRGGAKQITADAVLPIIILTVAFYFASFSLAWTIIVGGLVLTLLTYSMYVLPFKIPRTKFFFVWSIVSIVILFLIFQYVVVPFLEILQEENIAVGILLLGFIICVFMMKKRTAQLQYAQSGLNKTELSRSMQCGVCLLSVPDGDYHSYWFDCCIGQHNKLFFLLAKLFAIVALVYSANLTLTSVCHPFTFYKSILLPDDCSDVYQDLELGLSFVSACYSLSIAVLFLISVLQQILLISLGVTWQEWKEAPTARKIFFCSLPRPYTRGLFVNWIRVISNSICKLTY